ncbi:phage minor head protein [Flavobacterium sp. N1994]|uniref:phage minor head protein n=1 Tax=Flavobacterium sp. N1994 TaxID=2986827 RepID=UPI00222327C4|nr:phage minor head protein [Flavobacterium sp. N1994]
MWSYYYSNLADAIDTGYSPKIEMYDPQLAMSLKYNVGEFSAFKETSFRKQLESALTENGKTLSWSQFKEKTKELTAEYNQRWLRTEFDQTVATANMAEKWEGFVREKDLYPNLKYVTAGDARVREKHKAWDGLILPIGHQFWKDHYPPNDWGCRCNVINVDDNPMVEIPNVEGKTGFNNNAAITGKIFKDIPYADGLNVNEKNEARDYARKQMEELSFDKMILKKYPNGGSIESSSLVDKKAPDYTAVLNCCAQFAKLGKTAQIMPTIAVDSPLYKEFFAELIGTPYEGKCPDFAVDGIFYELEGFDKLGTRTLQRMFKRGLKQSSRIVLTDDGSTTNYILKVINYRVKVEKQVIDEVWILRKDGKLEQIY